MKFIYITLFYITSCLLSACANNKTSSTENKSSIEIRKECTAFYGNDDKDELRKQGKIKACIRRRGGLTQ